MRDALPRYQTLAKSLLLRLLIYKAYGDIHYNHKLALHYEPLVIIILLEHFLEIPISGRSARFHGQSPVSFGLVRQFLLCCNGVGCPNG